LCGKYGNKIVSDALFKWIDKLILQKCENLTSVSNSKLENLIIVKTITRNFIKNSSSNDEKLIDRISTVTDAEAFTKSTDVHSVSSSAFASLLKNIES
jgi:hypothetical protein